ncbi:Putative IS element transposase (plasmid) [Paraburkholderia phenoliruptrix BR3459a]|uniref:Putative IS element transposase n=1 Tax=Paraburkholderia phenoliruptrix BR3459a TaxID=1229205 RepID=K0E482_9BURK|nr:Putative IS element transposase [Paraburkholderia phenoliruptrix BR3459a]
MVTASLRSLSVGPVRWFCRFNLSLCGLEELLLERGVVDTYETILCRGDKFGAVLSAPKRRGGSQAASRISMRCS